jgi:phage tail protein X
MIKRYADIAKQKTGESKQRVYSSVIYPPIPRQPSDIYIQTGPGDRLDLLAYNYYGTVEYWWIIAEANGIGKGSFTIPPGLRLRIPRDAASIINDYRLLNT